ncbi:Ca-activated chloride channel family protein [Pedococcus dokdonensis]|uniref:Ca-activated chloride channel family protein n=1 Tax=Pedococcus dokdonensis TaxID=443156 RepID=A0A1H0QZV5_9MICO|nr:von Willebrand factor type A domain-containing protein [Pedococcus dokdonensis]SDP22680.1 Ca-activated chloride channel family protein [Pedococcus dokdonensis]
MAAPRVRRVVSTVAVAALLAATVAACGGGGSDGASAERNRNGSTYGGKANGSNGNGNNGSGRPQQVQPGPNGGQYVSPDEPMPPDDDRTSREPVMTDPREDALSTFALDIDTGSYTRFRDAVNQGSSAVASEVRTEEFVNYFEQGYATPREGLDVSIDAAALPFRAGHRLVRVGVSSAAADSETRRDADLVLVVDCSGSMSQDNKMETTKSALHILTGSLRSSDRVAMVCYSTEAAVALEPTRASDRRAIDRAIDSLHPQASTNAEAGLSLGYDLAQSMHGEGRMSRVILVSDGVANVGATGPGQILERISTQARAGTSLISVGVGIADYNDHLLEQLADRGDGWHVYIDDATEAERVFATGLTGSLVVAGRDAKAQVEFDPAQVKGYRLLGYENRDVADQDFRNDAVDGGEVFAGHTTTALYDVELRNGAGDGSFVTATVRYQDDRGRPVERTRQLRDSECARRLDQASPRLRQDLVVAMLADHLTDGPWSGWVSADTLREEAAALPDLLDGDNDVAELARLVDQATT